MKRWFKEFGVGLQMEVTKMPTLFLKKIKLVSSKIYKGKIKNNLLGNALGKSIWNPNNWYLLSLEILMEVLLLQI